MSSETNLLLREARDSDLPDLVACDAYAQVHEARTHELRRWVEQQSCFVALMRDRPVGFFVLEHTFFGNGFIPLVCVAGAHQHQGIGQFLLAQAERLCSTPKLFTSTNASNSRAQDLFARAGFTASGTVGNLDESDSELIYFKALHKASDAADPSGTGRLAASRKLPLASNVTPHTMLEQTLSILQALECELHAPKTRRDPERLGQLLHPQFREFGRSGRSYTRHEMLEQLQAETELTKVHSQDFRIEMLGHSDALLTYRSAQLTPSGLLERPTNRASIWRLEPTGWQMFFHQGTPTQAFFQNAA
ncbi:GNAT family N-acetyltransferase [Ottowia thiooxydans]|uniref:Ribosomal protein S18 acetylase RimI-like enzyme n=1 Tax=Ottowia thiooxydans TaxID=219182 RepID=A0ABV2Q8T1_9BURK